MSCLGLNVIQNGRLQVLHTIFIIFLILIYNLFWKDCFDHNNIETLPTGWVLCDGTVYYINKNDNNYKNIKPIDINNYDVY
jgi:hypothetical protein